jgi:hypothetical protein
MLQPGEEIETGQTVIATFERANTKDRDASTPFGVSSSM